MSKAAADCEEPWEVRPSAHYMMGGIRADAYGAAVGGDGDGSTSSGLRVSLLLAKQWGCLEQIGLGRHH